MPESDIDIVAIGLGPAYMLERRDGHLVSISWVAEADIRRNFQSPADAPGVVPGWRAARLLADPSGIAAAIQRDAHAWTWSEVGDDACNVYVAEEIAGLAEEIHKLVNHRRSGNLTAAAVQRAILSFRMGMVMAVHLRVLYETENDAWNLVNRRLGEPWTTVQARAFGLGDESFDVTCQAALDLYRLAAEQARPLFDDRQAAVVDHASRLSLILA